MPYSAMQRRRCRRLRHKLNGEVLWVPGRLRRWTSGEGRNQGRSRRATPSPGLTSIHLIWRLEKMVSQFRVTITEEEAKTAVRGLGVGLIEWSAGLGGTGILVRVGHT